MSNKPPSHLKSRRQIKIWEEQQKQNAAKRQKMDSYVNQNPFRYAERNFKTRNIPDSIMAQVIDTSELLNNKDATLQQFSNIQYTTLTKDLRESCPCLFGKADDQWRQRALDAYLLTDAPGLIIVPNPFTPEAQRQLIQHCLTDYALPPNISSLDAHYDRPAAGLWDLYKRQQQGILTEDDDNYYIQPKAQAASISSSLYGDSDDNGKTTMADAPSHSTLRRLSPGESIRKQRWVTLGYQYDWKTKVYDLDHGLPMPKELDDLAKTVVSAVEGVGSDIEPAPWKNTYSGSSFKAEAGVINYYQLRDTLMAHVDKSEVNMDAPLLSVSFGHSSIYLIGGSNKDIAPIPLCLRSGDLLIMSGESRKSYHGVPRILENTLPLYLSSKHDGADDDWKLYGEYMAEARINLNIRQVFPPP